MKVTVKDPSKAPAVNKVVVGSKTKTGQELGTFKWWMAGSQRDLAEQVLATALFLKQNQEYRFKQAGIYAMLYGNKSIFNVQGPKLSRSMNSPQLPIDRPQMNVVQSCIDTLVSRITQSRPRPIFLTDNGDYKQRKLAKQLNAFLNGELYQTKAYELGELVIRDAAILGTGVIKIYEDANQRVKLERVLPIELLVDPMEAFYNDPRQLYQIKLMDREVLQGMFPSDKNLIAKAEQAVLDQSSDASRSVSDQVMVVEAWHLPSVKNGDDGRHVIACSAGLILDEPYDRECFPFQFLHYTPPVVGFWGQGLAEQLMGVQVEINKLLSTISQAINLVGVPRVFLEAGSKCSPATLTNGVGAIVRFSGVKPIYEVAPCMPQEVYAQLQRLIEYAYQQSGVSALSASAQKPAGLNSGEAIRNYDDLQSDRFAALARRYDLFYIGTGYQIIDRAKSIVEETGSYETIYPNRQGIQQIELKDLKLLDSPFVIQCFDASSLPRDPAGRLEKVTEMAQSGMIDMQEARRLLEFPDLEQNEKLATSGEERILQILDGIVESGKPGQADPYMDLQLAIKLVTQYYNLYAAAKLEESRAQMLRDFHVSILTMIQAAQPPAPPPIGGGMPQAAPEAPPTSPLLPNAPMA